VQELLRSEKSRLITDVNKYQHWK